MIGACEDCLRRTGLLREVAGHLDPVRANILELLALGDEALVNAVGGQFRRRLARRWLALDAADMRREAEQAGLETICRCQPEYPPRLRDLPCPPAVLHIAGGLERLLMAADSDPVAIVGSRRASAHGTGVARSLGRDIAAAGVPVISGLAMGIDSAAHRGALSARTGGAPTVAILPGSAHEPYPSGARNLHRQLLSVGAAVSELPPGVSVRRWMFLARNRIIAALAAMTVVVEAGSRSGALLTARLADELGREVGAVPGRITSLQSAGPHSLIKQGAHLIDGPQEVLDLLFEAGAPIAGADARPELTSALRALLERIEEGHDTLEALRRQGMLPEQSLAALASLELSGYVERGAGGRFTVLP